MIACDSTDQTTFYSRIVRAVKKSDGFRQIVLRVFHDCRAMKTRFTINGHGTLPATDICPITANACYHENRDENKRVFRTSRCVTRVHILTLLLLLLYALNPSLSIILFLSTKAYGKNNNNVRKTNPPALII